MEMTARYAHFWGCFIPGRLPHVEKATRLVMERLGLQAIDMDGFTCCPEKGLVQTRSHREWLLTAARNLAIAEESGVDLITPCPGCLGTLAGAHAEVVGDSRARRAVRDGLAVVGRRYEGRATARHLLDVLDRDVGLVRLQQYAIKPMVGMRVAVHYGCHLIRPSQDVNFDDPFEPSRFDEMVEAIGAESVPYESKMLCCGGLMSRVDDEELGRDMVRTKLRELKRLEADAIVLACPSCMLQYDVTQSVLVRRGEDLGVPVLYYSELLCLAMGVDPAELGLSNHRVDVSPFLAKWEDHLDQLAGLTGTLDLRRVQNCADCGACVLECPVAQTDLNYDPSAVMRALAAGRLEEVLRSHDLWKCHDCYLCSERCWQGWSMLDTFREVRRIAIERGLAPETLVTGRCTLERDGRLVRPSDAHRKRLGLRPAPEADAAELRRLLNVGVSGAGEGEESDDVHTPQ